VLKIVVASCDLDGVDEDAGPPDDPGAARLEEATTDEERLQIEAELLEQTDNRPRPEDGEQPSQETEGPRGLGIRDRILARARSQLGIHERPFGSNRTQYSEWYGLIGPWCAMFVSWCFFHEGLPLPATTAKGFAYTPVGAAWFKRQGRWTRRPQVGAVIFFDFPGDGVDRISHVGIVERVNADGSPTCLEGNTNAPGGRTGGQVMRHRRSVGIMGYGLPSYGVAVGRPDEDPPDAAAGSELKEGAVGPEVARWQRQLNEATGTRLAVDGEFGPVTLQATKAFQRSAGLEPDGEVGPRTRRAMAKALAGKQRPAAPVLSVPRFGGRLIRRGALGKDVRRWQVQMSKLDFVIEVDGEYGPQSEGVCLDFQRAEKLEVDGIVGPETWTVAFDRS
jgi:peptidoglycan hydrolase-like protein with peptidoglycan-binding domain